MAENEEKQIVKIGRMLANKGLSIIKSEATKIGAAVFLAIISFTLILPIFFNNSALKFQITQKISQISEANFSIKGDIKIVLLPYPAIIAEDVLLENYKPKTEKNSPKIYNLYAKKMKIKFPVFSFSSDAAIDELTLSDAVMESLHENNSSTTRDNKLTRIIAELNKIPKSQETHLSSGISAKLFSIEDINSSQLALGKLPRLIIENGEAIIYDRFNRKKDIGAINVKTKINRKKISAEGSFSSENIVSNFKLLAKFNSSSNSPTSVLEVISPVMQLRIKGNFPFENKGIFASDFRGKIEAEIVELKPFYQSYISNADIISGKLKYSAKPIKISANIENLAQEISISDLKINSDLVSGNGNINLDVSGEVSLVDVDLDLASLDLDNIWSNNAIPANQDDNQNNLQLAANDETESLPTTILPDQQNQDAVAVSTPTEKTTPINLNLTKEIKDIDLTTEIKIKSIKYLDGEIKDANLYLTLSKEGEIMVLPLIFTIPGDGIFRVNGVFDNTAITPKFIGKFDASGKSIKEVLRWLKIESQNLKLENLREYSLYSDVMLLPNSITLNNFYLNLNNSSEFLGEAKIDNSNKISNIISRFRISNFNVDEHFLTSGQNAYFSPGLLLKKLLWLNDISSNSSIDLGFDKLIYKKEEFPNQSLKLRLGRGYLEISDLNLKSENTDLTANISVDISDKKQKFDITVNANNFHYDTLQQEAPLAFGDNITKSQKQNFFDQFFSLPSLEGFDGKISLNFKKLKIDDVEISKVILEGRLKDGNINVINLSSSIYGGTLDYKGLIGIKLNKTINGNLTFDNVSLQPLLSDIFGIQNVAGIANISANVTSVASSRSEFAKSLRSEIKFNANAPTIMEYGLNDLVKKMFAPQIYANDLRNPEQILINSQAQTVFKQSDGTIQINGGKDGKLRANITAPAVNGILSGAINLENNTLDLLFNTIFLTGNSQKQTPINIATNIKGPINNLAQSTNLDQARQYLGLPITTVSTSKILPSQDILPSQNKEILTQQ